MMKIFDKKYRVTTYDGEIFSFDFLDMINGKMIKLLNRIEHVSELTGFFDESEYEIAVGERISGTYDLDGFTVDCEGDVVCAYFNGNSFYAVHDAESSAEFPLSSISKMKIIEKLNGRSKEI